MTFSWFVCQRQHILKYWMGVVTFSFWIHQKTRKKSSRMFLALRTCFSHQMSAPVGAGFSSKHVSAELLATRCHRDGRPGPSPGGSRALQGGGLGPYTWGPPGLTDWLRDRHDWKHYLPQLLWWTGKCDGSRPIIFHSWEKNTQRVASTT